MLVFRKILRTYLMNDPKMIFSLQSVYLASVNEFSLCTLQIAKRILSITK